jgi:hypothetical protein
MVMILDALSGAHGSDNLAVKVVASKRTQDRFLMGHKRGGVVNEEAIVSQQAGQLRAGTIARVVSRTAKRISTVRSNKYP